MRPRLPSIRSAVLITGASASDRGWIRDIHVGGFAITLFKFFEAARVIPTLAASFVSSCSVVVA